MRYIALLILILPFFPQSAHGTPPSADEYSGAIGWTGNTGEPQWLGIWVIAVGPRHGVYLDYRIPHNYSRLDNYYESISINKAENIFGDRLTNQERSASTFDVAYALRVAQPVVLYVGIGVSSYSYYREYYDRLEILGQHGHYWISDSSRNHKEMNGVAGIVLAVAPRFALTFGYQTEPEGLSLGLGMGTGWAKPTKQTR